MALPPGCRFGDFSYLLYEPRSFGVCKHCAMPRHATVNDCTPRTKSEEEEYNDTSNGGKDDDGQALVSLARRTMGVRGVMG